ncbi:hypothetical protein PGT21_027958 [Puccinia graminis f. sp. tritici]|uniref:Uncharacterized protein n=1 Tax=Puccinia graminis f. sp. tritici TaxID=56615 RepID=A0A5B0RS48_PUCGR|nr:hypothetical protein PGT21_027958 [Puccinia graminis f. sp. tritici]KAA1128098.1 hypothetical protein PGTUg99_008431 [Puccinia graminis f. sp. tritici]
MSSGLSADHPGTSKSPYCFPQRFGSRSSKTAVFLGVHYLKKIIKIIKNFGGLGVKPPKPRGCLGVGDPNLTPARPDPSQILSNQTLHNLDHFAHSTTHKQPFLDISSPLHLNLLKLEMFFKLVLHKNYFQLNQKFIKPKLKKIITTPHHQEEEEDKPMTTKWDKLLFLVFLSSNRLNLIWRVVTILTIT